jgi:hypothetical protein
MRRGEHPIRPWLARPFDPRASEGLVASSGRRAAVITPDGT